jgi:hypothetical protein
LAAVGKKRAAQRKKGSGTFSCHKRQAPNGSEKVPDPFFSPFFSAGRDVDRLAGVVAEAGVVAGAVLVAAAGLVEEGSGIR